MSKKDDIRQNLKRKLQAQRKTLPQQDNYQGASQLGVFLTARCRDKGWAAADLATSLDIEEELAEAVLAGFLPATEFDRGFLIDLSTALDCDLQTLIDILET